MFRGTRRDREFPLANIAIKDSKVKIDLVQKQESKREIIQQTMSNDMYEFCSQLRKALDQEGNVKQILVNFLDNYMKENLINKSVKPTIIAYPVDILRP